MRWIARVAATLFGLGALYAAVTEPHGDRVFAWVAFGVCILILFATDTPKEQE